MIDCDFPADKSVLRGAVGVNLDGYYAVIFDTTVYICDYSVSGFRYISSYNKPQDANGNIPWFKWQMNGGGMFFGCGNLICSAELFSGINKIAVSKLGKDYANAYDTFYRLKDGAAEVLSEDIPSRFETKHFDFGAPERNKIINEVDISFADNGGRDILFEIRTEKGLSYSKSFINIVTSADARSMNYTRNRIFRNVMTNAAKVSLGVSSYGTVGVRSVTLIYGYSGGAK